MMFLFAEVRIENIDPDAIQNAIFPCKKGWGYSAEHVIISAWPLKGFEFVPQFFRRDAWENGTGILVPSPYQDRELFIDRDGLLTLGDGGWQLAKIWPLPIN